MLQLEERLIVLKSLINLQPISQQDHYQEKIKDATLTGGVVDDELYNIRALQSGYY